MVNFSSVMFFVPSVMVFCGMWGFINYSKHMLNSLLSSLNSLLNSLLSLEFMMLGVFWLLSTQLALVGSEIYFSLLFFNSCSMWGGLSFNYINSSSAKSRKSYFFKI